MNNFPGRMWNETTWVPGEYFNQSSYYKTTSGDLKRIETMNRVHARNAIKKYRKMFPDHVQHINRTVLGKALRRKYLSR